MNRKRRSRRFSKKRSGHAAIYLSGVSFVGAALCAFGMVQARSLVNQLLAGWFALATVLLWSGTLITLVLKVLHYLEEKRTRLRVRNLQIDTSRAYTAKYSRQERIQAFCLIGASAV